jgi:hypothetical protein
MLKNENPWCFKIWGKENKILEWLNFSPCPISNEPCILTPIKLFPRIMTRQFSWIINLDNILYMNTWGEFRVLSCYKECIQLLIFKVYRNLTPGKYPKEYTQFIAFNNILFNTGSGIAQLV